MICWRAHTFACKSQAWLRPGRFPRIKGLLQQLKRYRALGTTFIDRGFTVCTPFEGANALHAYEPPFGLGNYDDRFKRQP